MTFANIARFLQRTITRPWTTICTDQGTRRLPTLSDYETAAYWASEGWIDPWLETVDPSYWREMVQCIGEYWMPKRRNWREHVLTDAGRAALRTQLVTRISQASSVFVPWLEQALEMRGLRILEIGCGSGSSTAGLAHAGAHVTGVDIKGPSMVMARKRLSLLGLQADIREASETWLQQEVDADAFEGPFDLIVCYAVIEHLLIPERLNLLRLCRKIMERDGARLATFETPNRFAPFDWHSSKLMFTDVLPDDLAIAYSKARSPRKDHPAVRTNPSDVNEIEKLYRFGRGASWHEFDVAFGLQNLRVLLDGYSQRSKFHQKHYKPNKEYEKALAALFAQFDPPVPRGFCRPSLELLLELNGSSPAQ